MVKNGVINQNTYVINPLSVGLEICAFVQMIVPIPSEVPDFIHQINLLDEVKECHYITKEYSYLIKVRTKNTIMLERFLTEKIKSINGVAKINTIIELSTSKGSHANQDSLTI